MPPSRQIREDFVDWPVGNVFVHTVTALPEREGDLVAHAEQLGKAQHPLLKFKEIEITGFPEANKVRKGCVG